MHLQHLGLIGYGEVGRIFAAGLGAHFASVRVWDIEARSLLRTLEGHVGGVYCGVLPGGVVAAAAKDGKIKLWDISTGKLVRSVEGRSCIATYTSRAI